MHISFNCSVCNEMTDRTEVRVVIQFWNRITKNVLSLNFCSISHLLKYIEDHKEELTIYNQTAG